MFCPLWGGGPHEASTLGYVAGGPKVDEAAGIPDWLMPMTRPRGIFS